MPEVEGEVLQESQPAESVVEETTTAEDSGTSDNEQENQQPEPKKEVSDGVQKRIDKLTAQRRDAERRLAELERKLAEKENQPAKAAEPASKPTPDKYSTYEEYVEALTDWKTEQKLAASLAAQKAEAAKAKEAEKLSHLTQGWNESVRATQKAHADYEDAIQEAAEEIESGERSKLPDSTFNAIMETDSKAEILYYLANNRADYEALAKASGNRVLIELGKIEAKLAGAGTVQDKPKVTNAPKPPSAVGGRAKGSFDPNDPNVPIDEWMKRERERSQRR